MKTICLMFAATTLLAASLARAAPAPGPVETGEVPLACLLHFTSAVPEATRFGDDGSTTLAWEDSLGRRSEARVMVDGSVVMHSADGRVQHHPPRTRVPDGADRARLDEVMAEYWRLGVDLAGRRLVQAAASDWPPPYEPPMVWDNQSGLWVLLEACDQAERTARAVCSAECAQEGMNYTYRPGRCGSGSSCTCVYTAEASPFG